MIWQPKIGQKVRINYGDKTRSNLYLPKKQMPCQGMTGTILAVSKGPGPLNVLVEPDPWWPQYIIPKGNLIEFPKHKST